MGWNFVNVVRGEGSAASTTAASAGSHTAGNMLVVGASVASGGINVSSISDTAGNIYQAVPSATMGSGDKRVHLWYAENIIGNASNVVTVTWSAGTGGFREVHVAQYSNDVGNCIGVSETGATGSTLSNTSVTSGSFSPAADGNLNVAFHSRDGGGTVVAGGSYTLRGTNGSSNGRFEDLLSAVAGAQTASFSWSTNTVAAIAVGSFKPPSGANRQKRFDLVRPFNMAQSRTF